MEQNKEVRSKAAVALAKRIEEKAEAVLSGLAKEMTVMRWESDYQEIMWSTVGRIAFRRAASTRSRKAG